MTRTKVSWCIFWPFFLARSHSSGLVCRMLLRFFLWMFHATETHRQRQLLCHSTGCGLATKMTVVCVLIETLPWILSLQQYQDLFIKMKMSWLTWTPLSASRMMFVGESLPRPMLHEQPASLCIFPKSLTFPRATWQLRISVKGGSASAKQVTSQTGNFLWALLGHQS